MSCPGTEARLNRRQQATVEKEHGVFLGRVALPTSTAGIARGRAPQPVKSSRQWGQPLPRFPCRRLRSVCDVRDVGAENRVR